MQTPTTMIADGRPATQLRTAGRIAVVAGDGKLPEAIVGTLMRNGENPFVVVVAGEGTPPSVYADSEHMIMRMEEIGLLLPALHKAGVKRMVLAGGISRRARLRSARITWSLVKNLPKLIAGLRRGDDGLLRSLIGIVEAEGISVVGAHEIAPELLAPLGVMTRLSPTSSDKRDIAAASEAAIAIGRLDIGQAAVAVGGRCIALEGIEGTDGLLDRTRPLRANGRIAGRTRGVLVKRCKPTQDLRADLPAIGPRTIDAAHAAGLAGVAVDARRSFILDYEATIARADELGLFVVGLSPEGSAS